MLNTLHNLRSEGQIIIRSTFLNEVTGEILTSEYTNYFPSGNYTYSSMLAVLNAVLPAFSNTPYPNTVYGLGGEIIPPVPPQQPSNLPVSKSPIGAYFIFEQYADILDQTFPGQQNEHLYLSFELIFTQEVYNLWVILGLTKLQNPSPGSEFSPPPNYSIHIGVQTRNYDALNDETTITYNVGAPIQSPNVFNFSSTSNLYLVANGQLSSQFRYPFSNNNPSNLIAVIPVTVPYGFMIYYAPQSVAKCSIKNMNLSNLELTIYDDRGYLIDTHGTDFSVSFIVNFGIDEKQQLNVSGMTGLPNNLPTSTPSDFTHYAAKSYNDSSGRDALGSSSKNILSSMKRFRP